jgi:hypothetical protein
VRTRLARWRSDKIKHGGRTARRGSSACSDLSHSTRRKSRAGHSFGGLYAMLTLFLLVVGLSVSGGSLYSFPGRKA